MKTPASGRAGLEVNTMFISREKWNNLLIRVEALEFAVKNSNSTQDLVEKVSQEISLSIDKNTNVWDFGGRKEKFKCQDENLQS